MKIDVKEFLIDYLECPRRYLHRQLNANKAEVPRWMSRKDDILNLALGKIEPIDVSISELEAIIERSKSEPLGEQECQTLQSVIRTLLFLTQELEKKHVSVARLKKMLFGAATEKLKNVIDEVLEEHNKQQKKDSNSQNEKQEKPVISL